MGCTYRLKKSPFWWIKYVGADGRPQYESSHATDRQIAIDLLKSREGKIADGIPVTSAMGRMKFREAAADLLKDFETNKRKSTDELDRRLRLHLLPYFGRFRMVEIDTPMIRRYIAHRQAEARVVRKAHTIIRDGARIQVPAVTRPPSNGEMNRELQHLKRCFNLARKEGRLLHAPYVPMLREDNVRTGFLEPDQLQAVLTFLPDDLRPVIGFAYLTGWRVASEVLPLTWSRVDFAAGEVRLDPGTTKNGDGRIFPITPDLRSLLKDQRDHTDSVQRDTKTVIPIVFHRTGEPIRSLNKAWRTACRQAGYPGRILHDMRRSAVRNMVRDGVPETVAMKLSGHKTRSVFDRYNITSARDLHEAGSRLRGLAGTANLRAATGSVRPRVKLPAVIGSGTQPKQRIS